MFDAAALQALKKAYNRAVQEGQEQFMFSGQVLLVGYAKYLIEYLETKIK